MTKNVNQKHILKVSRLTALTNGIFAVAMTILVFNLHLPSGTETVNLESVLKADILESIFIYAGSFIILGTLWIGISFQHAFLEQVNRTYLWANILYLMFVCIVPFSASLVVDYPKSPTSISFYAINLICTSMTQFLIWQCVNFYKLNGDAYSEDAHQVVLRRIFVAPLFCTASLIAAHWNTAIAFVALIAPIVIYIIPGKVDSYFSLKK